MKKAKLNNILCDLNVLEESCQTDCVPEDFYKNVRKLIKEYKALKKENKQLRENEDVQETSDTDDYGLDLEDLPFL